MNAKASTASFKQSLSALFLGMLVGIVLVTVYGFIESWLRIVLTGREGILPPSAVALASFLVSTEYALLIAVVCAPLWLLISKVGWDGAPTAGLLGCGVTSVIWFLGNQPFLGPSGDDLAYALCGAVAGLVTWWAAHRR